MAEVLLLPSLYLGFIIGLYEALLLHRDVSIPTHRFGHMMHALIFAIIAVFASMNVGFLYDLFPSLSTVQFVNNPLIFRIIIGIILMIKMHAVSAALGKGASVIGMREKWTHTFIIGALVVGAPYFWPFIQPFVSKYLPV